MDRIATTMTRDDIGQLCARLENHAAFLQRRLRGTQIGADVMLAAGVLRAATARGFPVGAIDVAIESPAGDLPAVSNASQISS